MYKSLFWTIGFVLTTISSPWVVYAGQKCAVKVSCYRTEPEFYCLQKCKHQKHKCESNKKLIKHASKPISIAACRKHAGIKHGKCLAQGKVLLAKCRVEIKKMKRSCKTKAASFWKMCKEAKRSDCEQMKASTFTTCFPEAEKSRCKNEQSQHEFHCHRTFQATMERCRAAQEAALSPPCDRQFKACRKTCYLGYRVCHGVRVKSKIYDPACMKKCLHASDTQDCHKQCKRQKWLCTGTETCGRCQ